MRPPCPAVALPTLLSRLRACRSASHALQCHALLLTSGHLAASPLRLSNHLLLALASVPSAAALADVVFARLPLPAARDPFAWNTAIRLHAPARPRAALLYFARMRRCGVRPDAYTFPAVLKACGCAPGCRAGLLVHAEAVRRGLAADLFTVNALISFYCRILDIRSGRKVFDEAGGVSRDLVSWNSMVAGCGEAKEALEYFQSMLRCGLRPDRIAAVGAVSACAQLGALEQGRWLHSYLEKKKLLSDVVVQTALIDMYVKCGCLDLAMLIFESMAERSVVTWNVMIVGLGTHGFGLDAVTLFHRMEAESVAVDDLSVLGMLTACTHAGLVSEGLEIFHRMKKDFGIDPKVEHYGALVDLLGRAGRLDQARHAIETMPMEPTPELWGSLLAACRSHSCVELAELSVERLADLGADDSGVYVLLSNIYADEGMWGDVLRIRKLMSDEGMRKDIGRSVIEVDGEIHEFVNGVGSYICKDEMYLMLWNLSNMVASI
ncbi:Pentatricopeptide repeat-containing protein chloroplastic [Zea mays]|uniref:Pentatricopeptide repeat-containing protein chloroplastic n=1 Tax=Zea mays TaxID=4577 RepID=A0A1D6N3D5_MAIZE|nr:Pentatricopeptide repeat-containing protein chloroplastic [Zea mays]